MNPVLIPPMHANPGDQPPALTLERIFTAWTFDPAIAIAAAVTIGLYLWGVIVLARRGVKWPLSRTLAWCLGGVGIGVVATMSSLGAYDTVLLSMHMVQHMLLAMMVPVFLAVGAPATLMLRTLPQRPRRWLVWLLHSRLAKVAMHPVLTYCLFVFNPFVLYFTDLYDLTLRSEFWHNWLHLHFIVTGCLFFWPLLGNDPVPTRLVYPLRMLLLFATLPFHAFLGVIIMGSHDLIGEEWYLSFERTWGPSIAEDQYVGGGILWGSGDLTILVIMAVLFVHWVRDSNKEAVREDRRLDRLEAEENRRRARDAAGTGYDRPGDGSSSTTSGAAAQAPTEVPATDQHVAASQTRNPDE